MKRLCICCGAAVLLGPVIGVGLFVALIMFGPDLPDSVLGF